MEETLELFKLLESVLAGSSAVTLFVVAVSLISIFIVIISSLVLVHINESINSRAINQFKTITDDYITKRESIMIDYQNSLHKIVADNEEKMERIMAEKDQYSQQVVLVLKAIKPVLNAFIEKSDDIMETISKDSKHGSGHNHGSGHDYTSNY